MLPSRPSNMSGPAPVSTLGVDTLVEYLHEHGCLFRDVEEFKRKLTKVIVDGPENLFCISDFDFTLSKYFRPDGTTRADSCHASLENAPMLDATYTTAAKALQAHYYPLEIDSTISEPDRFRYMEEWVEKHNALLVQSRITPRSIRQVVSKALDDNRLVLRRGLEQLVSILGEQNIPLLIFSAGIADVVEVAVTKTLGVDQLPAGVAVISNKMIFQDSADEDSPLVDWSRPFLHVLNKRALEFLNHDFFKAVKSSERRNLLLFGDSPGDPRMSIGVEEDFCETVIKVGFLNVSVEERKAEFLKSYDVAFVGDPELDSSVIPILQLVCLQLR